MKQKNKQKLSGEETAEIVATKLQIASEKQGMKRVCFVVDSNVELERMENRSLFSDIAAKTGDNPTVSVLENILGRSGSLAGMAENDGAVIVFQTETARFTDVQYERNLCESSGVAVLGAIIVE